MNGSVTSVLLAILTASATLAGLVVVFIATATNQMKVLRHEDQRDLVLRKNPYETRYEETQYLLLEWAALAAFVAFTLAIMFAGVVLVQCWGCSSATIRAWIPLALLAMVVFGIAVMLVTTVGVVYNDHRLSGSVGRRRQTPSSRAGRAFQMFRKNTVPKILAFVLGSILLTLVSHRIAVGNLGQEPKYWSLLWKIPNPVWWIVLLPSLASEGAVFLLYRLSGYRPLIVELDTQHIHGLIRSSDGKVLFRPGRENGTWVLPSVAARSSKEMRTHRQLLSDTVKTMLRTDPAGQKPSFTTVDTHLILVPPEGELMPRRYVYKVIKTEGDFSEEDFMDVRWLATDEALEAVPDDLRGALCMECGRPDECGHWRQQE